MQALGRQGGVRKATANSNKNDNTTLPKTASAPSEGPKKIGRPAVGEPWKELGLSRRTWERRRKAGDYDIARALTAAPDQPPKVEPLKGKRPRPRPRG
jgi:hypothetical protein